MTSNPDLESSEQSGMEISMFLENAPIGKESEVELVLSKFDKDGNGLLSADEVYDMIMAYSRSKKQSRRKSLWLAAAVAFMVLLALANVGTSFAAALLAKDSKVVNGAIVDKADSRALSTMSAHGKFDEDHAIVLADLKAIENKGGVGSFSFIGDSITCEKVLTTVTHGEVKWNYLATQAHSDYQYGYTIAGLNVVFSPKNVIFDPESKVYHANSWSEEGITNLYGIFVVCTDALTAQHHCPVCASGVRYLPNGSVEYNE